MDADHANLCKFPTSDGDAYEQVMDNLVDLAERAIQASAERQRLTALSVPSGLFVAEQQNRACT